MKHYIECRNAEYDKIRVAFWRTRLNRALDLLAGIGFETFMCGKDLADRIIDIVKAIECEVR